MAMKIFAIIRTIVNVFFILMAIRIENVQEAFHVYLNIFEIVVTHLFLVILCKS